MRSTNSLIKGKAKYTPPTERPGHRFYERTRREPTEAQKSYWKARSDRKKGILGRSRLRSTRLRIRSHVPIRREIRVGERIVIGCVCVVCPGSPAIYPESSMAKHIERHELTVEERDGAISRYHGGRTPGSTNVHKMSSTGVIHRRGIVRLDKKIPNPK